MFSHPTPVTGTLDNEELMNFWRTPFVKTLRWDASTGQYSTAVRSLWDVYQDFAGCVSVISKPGLAHHRRLPSFISLHFFLLISARVLSFFVLALLFPIAETCCT